MAGNGRNDDLPPGYVTILHLRDIWMEKKRKEKEEEERKLAEEKRKQEEEDLRKQQEELRKQQGEKRNGGRRRERGRKTGLIDEEGKGKGVIVGGYGNVEGDKKRSNDRSFRRPKSRGGERNRNEEEREREKIRVEKRGHNGKEVVLMNGVRGGISDGKRVEFRGGLRKNGGNRGRNEGGDGLNQLNENEGGSDLGGGVLDDKGYYQKRVEGGRNNGGYQNRNYRLEESRDAVLKGKGVEPETVKKGEVEIVEVLGEGSGRNGYKWRSRKYRGRSNKFRESRDAVLRGNGLELETEKKGEDGLVEVFNEKCSLSERDRNGEEKRKVTNEVKVDGEGLRDDSVALENKVGDGVIAVDSVKNGEKEGVGEGFRRNGNSRGDSGNRRLGNGYRRYGNWKGRFVERRDNRFKESGDAVLIGNKLELETEKKAEENILAKGEGSSDDRVALESKVEDGVLMVESVKNGEKEGVGKGRRRFGKGKGKVKDRNDKEKRIGTSEDKVEGEGSSEDRVAVESKVDDGVLAMESVINGEKEGVGVESRGENRKGKADDKIITVFNLKFRLSGDSDDDEGNKTNEDRAKAEGSSGDNMALESKVDDGVLTVENMKKAEMEGVGKAGYGRHRNREENFGGRRWGNGYNRFGNVFNSRIANRRGNVSGMIWVKKEEKLGPVAAGASGGSARKD